MKMFLDVSFSAEAIGIIGAMGAGLIGAIAMLFKLLLAAKDKQLADMTSARDSFKEIAEESVTNVEQIVNRLRVARGQEEFKPLKPVVPEHASPVMQAQKETAELQTLRAKLVAATLNLDLPPRESSRPATPAEEKQLKAGGKITTPPLRDSQVVVAEQTAIAASAVASAAELASTAAQTASDAATISPPKAKT